MNLLSVKRKGHGRDEWIRRETPNSRGLQLVKSQALLDNKYHFVLHNDRVLVTCGHRMSNPSKVKESESEVAQSCPTLCDPVDCSPPGSFVHGILQARILEWVAIPFSRGSSQPRDQTQVSCIAVLQNQV